MQYTALFLIVLGLAFPRSAEAATPHILERHQWGADESLLFQNDVEKVDPVVKRKTERGKRKTEKASSPREYECSRKQIDHSHDFVTEQTVTHAANGRRLRWARRYSKEITRLVVHHTAQKNVGDKRSGMEKMRALYEYHAKSRGWGDVGYHYIIDPRGWIYEGRSGGDYVVGGHVYCANVKTIGVALMGDFEVERPTDDQIASLQWLLNHLSKKYDVNLRRNIAYHGEHENAIVGHKDLGKSECPGHFLKSVLTQIRSNVIAGNLDAKVKFPIIAQGKSAREKRISSRLQKAGQEMSRRFYRAKRLARTSARKQPESGRQKLYSRSRDAAANVQRRRAVPRVRRVAGVRRSRNTTVTKTTPIQAPRKAIRIRLGFDKPFTNVSSNGNLNVDGNAVASVRLGKDGNSCIALAGSQTVSEGIVRIQSSDGIVNVEGMPYPFTQFRGVIECRVVDGKLTLINELSMKDYLSGLAEEPDTEHFQKQRAFAIAARSYAAHYMNPSRRKFPGKPYDGDDSPARFQAYKGVYFESKNPQWLKAVEDTLGIVMMHDGEIVKAAYYSSNDGRTRSPAELGWSPFPHEEVFASKKDPWCAGLPMAGHGVGMSGCGAKGQAAEGKSAEEILQYYYPGTKLKVIGY